VGVWIVLPLISILVFAFLLYTSPPAQADKAADEQWGESEINDACIQTPGRLFAKLLRRPGADGTLRIRLGCAQAETQEEQQHDKTFHTCEFGTKLRRKEMKQ
jgi:hypothetical protein